MCTSNLSTAFKCSLQDTQLSEKGAYNTGISTALKRPKVAFA